MAWQAWSSEKRKRMLGRSVASKEVLAKAKVAKVREKVRMPEATEIGVSS